MELRGTKKKKESPLMKKNTKPVKKKRDRPSPVEEDGGGNGESSTQPSKRPRRNPKNLHQNPVASPTPADPILAASPTPSASPTQSDNEVTRSAEARGTPSSEREENPEETGLNHGDALSSQEHNATEVKIRPT
ncbi:unnamed protein product [Eruca vesicaria subsp. sativa]|uniref:Uncharacterized protein n=1 Tax=Eruca vesicaria subsp. sativa TaxID=29727 RepID=A0ABC8JE92_ERUVS|nr:unnamed protein product [Eruca vesicaria subsp. sativa]